MLTTSIQNEVISNTLDTQKTVTHYNNNDTYYTINISSRYKKYICPTEKIQHILVDPQQCGKGHLFCSTCTIIKITTNKDRGIKVCPVCSYIVAESNSDFTLDAYNIIAADIKLTEQINSIAITCPTKDTFTDNVYNNYHDDCLWQGNLSELNTHLNGNCTLIPANKITDLNLLKLEELKHKIIRVGSIIYRIKRLANTSANSSKQKLTSADDANQITYYSLKSLTAEKNTQIEKFHQKLATLACETIFHPSETLQNYKDIEQYQNGKIIWAISDYTARKNKAIKGEKTYGCSPSFYTSPTGYKFATKIYFNGDGCARGSHLSLFIVMMKGEYDDSLTWPFKGRITFTLYNLGAGDDHYEKFVADSTSLSFQKPITDENVASGTSKFISLYESDGCSNFSKNDTLYIGVNVKVDHDQK